MVYALNVFNLLPGKEDQYRDYSVKAGKIIYGFGGKVVASGWQPLRRMHEDRERRHFIVVEFPSEAVFQQFLDEADRQHIHALREGACSDYIWTLYQPWDMRAWVRDVSASPAVDRPTLVLLPGLLCDAALFAPQVQALAGICRTWIPNLSRDDTMEGLARRVLNEAPAPSFSLAGLSMGGYVAMEIMRQAPHRVQRLALLDTRARPDSPDELERRRTLMRIAEGAKGFAPVNKRMLPLLVHPSRLEDATLVRIVEEMADRTGIPGYLRQQSAIMSRVDLRPGLPDIACPTLVLCGREDAITPVAFHEEIAAAIPGAHLAVLEQCGHLSTLEQPAEVSAALRAWLTG